MANWVYNLKNSKPLRQAIHDEDYNEVLDSLINCFTEINRRFPEEYDSSDLDTDLEDIENVRDNLDNYEDYDMSFEDAIDGIDYMLNDLYDLCDALRIWIEI